MNVPGRRDRSPLTSHTLESLESEWGHQALAIYDTSFAIEDRETRDQIAQIVLEPRAPGEVRHFRIMVDAEGIVRGISIFTTVHAAGMGYLRSLAIHPDARNEGLGPVLLRDIINQVRRDGLRRMLLPYLGVVLEAERPGDAATDDERQIRQRRSAWYRRNGGRMFAEVDLVTPPPYPDLPPRRYHVSMIRGASGRLPLSWWRPLLVRAVLASGYGEPLDGSGVRRATHAPLSPIETWE